MRSKRLYLKKNSTKTIAVANAFKSLNSKVFGRVRVVTNIKEAEGYVNLEDLCRILELSVKDVMSNLPDRLYSIAVENPEGQHHKMSFVDESGLYMMYLLSKKKNTIHFQNWLHKEYFELLLEQQKVNAGVDKDLKLVVEFNRERQALRYMATAANVIKSGHFMKGKAIPELTLSHLIGWWHNNNDQSIFMLQFNCLTDCFIYDNVRMNVYLRKMVDGRIDFCDMHISFLDLDADNHEFFVIDTIMPSSTVLDGSILEYIMEDQFIDTDIMDPESLDPIIILNGTMSFHRSRRMENKGQPLIEFV